MAWTYSDWITLSGSAQRSQLALHIQEVADRVSESRSKEGFSTNTQPVLDYLKHLQSELKRLGGVGRSGLQVVYPVKELAE